MPQREIDILSLLVEIDEEWRPRSPREIKNVISTDNRKYLMAETRINKNNLTKYINILKKKGVIVKREDSGYEVLKSLIPIIKDNKVTVTFILDLNED